MELRGKQKRFLRSKAHHLQPIFQVGKGGLNEAMIHQIAEALEKREIFWYFSLLEGLNVLHDEINCEIVQIIGRVVVLFKPSSKEKYQKISPEVKGI